ncbi:MAG: EAL domain-containing protein [Bacillota bacterium]|nr:EAL domain-containing protein [Bacillota bacterium]
MIAKLIIFFLCSSGISISVLVAANVINNRFGYSIKKGALLTALWLGLVCFLLNYYSLTLDGIPVICSKVILLMYIAVSCDIRTLAIFAPLYIVSVAVSPFSLIIGVMSMAFCIIIPAICKNKLLAVFAVVYSIMPLSLSEVLAYKYIPAYDSKQLWAIGIGIQLFLTLQGVVLWVLRNTVFVSLLTEYAMHITGKLYGIYCFEVNDKNNTVVVSKAMADRFEFPDVKMSCDEFRKILNNATDSKVEAFNENNKNSFFVTPVTYAVHYIKYSCMRGINKKHIGYISDITGMVPRYEMLYRSAQKDFQTGLLTYKNLTSYLLNISKENKGKVLCVTVIPVLNITGHSEYNEEFELQCDKILIDILKTFDNSELFYVSKGQYIFVVNNIYNQSTFDEISYEIKLLAGDTYLVGDTTVKFETKLGFFSENANAINSFEDSKEVLEKLMFCIMRQKCSAGGNIYSFSSCEYKDYLDCLLRIRYLPIIFKEEKLRIVFQPIISLTSGKAEMCEVLVRADHEAYRNTRTLVNDCIREGLDVELDKIVYKKLRKCLESGIIPALNYSVNINGNTPVGEDAIETAKILKNAGYNLYLEMVEHMRVPENILKDRMLKARQNDIKLAADDYGQNTSTLETLYKTDFDILKIPMDFIVDIDSSKKKRMFVSNILHYCKESGIKCVAEGVERAGELYTLMDLGVDYVQGYYFSKPQDIVPETGKIFFNASSSKAN